MRAVSNIFVRTVFGAVYVLLILVPFLLQSEWLFAIVFSFIAFTAVVEFNKLTSINRTRPLRTILDGIIAVWMLLNGMLVAKGMYLPEVWLPLVVYLLYTLLKSLFSDKDAELPNIGNSLMMLTYIGVPIFLTAYLSYQKLPTGEYVFMESRIIAVFLIVWIADSAAYLSGMAFGKHPLWPALSPKKTIEGLVGGVAFAAIVASLFPIFFPSVYGAYTWYSCTIYGLLVSLMSVLGDLFESMLKRRAGVKDSGHLIPGHGGILDRIDSYLMALPTAFILYLLAHTC